MKKHALFGKDLFDEPIEIGGSMLQQRFIQPPFTVLSAHGGVWQDRKSAWKRMGIRSEEGRTGLCDTCCASTTLYNNGKMLADGSGSIFDPVICELMYSWFCPSDGIVLDPFCGGSVRGIVAAILGRRYWGCDLREEQVVANKKQGKNLLGKDVNRAIWICGDSLKEVVRAPQSDFIFSCPPYGDLETYSDDPRDISNMGWDGFAETYSMIIQKACARLRDDRFACFVVGNFRDKKTGCIRDLVGATIHAFANAGCGFYNDAIINTSVGTAALRATRTFTASRKLVRTHQNILVFCKGDHKAASDACAAFVL